jgi:hypothetical protein
MPDKPVLIRIEPQNIVHACAFLAARGIPILKVEEGKASTTIYVEAHGPDRKVLNLVYNDTLSDEIREAYNRAVPAEAR